MRLNHGLREKSRHRPYTYFAVEFARADEAKIVRSTDAQCKETNKFEQGKMEGKNSWEEKPTENKFIQKKGRILLSKRSHYNSAARCVKFFSFLSLDPIQYIKSLCLL